MDTFAAELHQRITSAREQLHAAQDAGDLDAERIYSGELDSLLRQALENGITVPPEDTGQHA
ncbi:hypothetical protein EV651_109114 [Kribbella sp. VKM Ac-2571]|uniref:hypothetical protein n=1 Tax=Kribbella sp. VKM Ac-2571 TaxID=2512222 RepID=UPI00105BAD08|nr:hypothetical protein [Kribbella sp. VKM Ac-2571]TDO58839.1 hypothetical protein EV651_109114 [Kribbella sp. VKM Ac-2571]